MLALRGYQERAIADLRAEMASGKRAPLLCLPTGAGKTLCAAAMIQAAIARSRRVLFAAHRTELLTQTLQKLAAAGIIDVRLIQAAKDLGRADAPVIVGSVQTITNRPPLDRVDLIIADEAHHFVADSFSRIVRGYPNAFVIGLSATPQRADGKPLGDIFDAIVIGATVQELTDLGYLVPCRVFAPIAATTSREIALQPLEAYLQHGQGQRAICFSATVAHAKAVAASFTAADIPCESVFGSMRGRAETLQRFAAGELRVIASVNVLLEGFDDPGAAVAIVCRKMGHAGTWIQCIGRVLRPAPGKLAATVIDLCGSALEHGTPTTPREYSLDGEGIRKSDRATLRQCPSCGGVFGGAVGSRCPMCSAELPLQKRHDPKSSGVGVVEVTAGMPRPVKPAIIRAKRQGSCTRCLRAISPGDWIVWVKGSGTAIHTGCSSRIPRAGEQVAA